MKQRMIMAAATLMLLIAACSTSETPGTHTHADGHTHTDDHAPEHDGDDLTSPLSRVSTSDRWFGEIAGPSTNPNWQKRFADLDSAHGLADTDRHVTAATRFLSAVFFNINQSNYPYFAQPVDSPDASSGIQVLAANATQASVGAVDVVIAFVPVGSEQTIPPMAALVTFADETDPLSVIDYATVTLPADAHAEAS